MVVDQEPRAVGWEMTASRQGQGEVLIALSRDAAPLLG